MPTTPTITRQRSRPGLRLVEASGLPACLVVARPRRGDCEVLVIVSDAVSAPRLRQLGRVVLRDIERRHLARFLDLRRKR